MPNNNDEEQIKPVRRTWIMIKRAKPVLPSKKFYTNNNKAFITADNKEFFVKGE